MEETAKQKWIHVGRVQGKDITEKQIKNYLVEIDGGEEVEVKKLKTQGTNSAFSVGVPTYRRVIQVYLQS